MSTHLDQYRALARYNRDFNAQLYEVVAALPDDDRTRDLGAFFGSVHRTLNHILLADRIWLGRIRQWRPLDSLRRAEVVETFGGLDHELFSEHAALTEARAATDADLLAFCEELRDDDLAHVVTYANSRGVARSHPLWIAVTHLFNHQAHHRGQATTLLTQLGRDVGTTDFMVFATR